MKNEKNTANIQTLTRVFKFGALALEDPGSHFSETDVRDYYSAHYPHLTGAAVKGPVVENGKAIWTFETKVGTKG